MTRVPANRPADAQSASDMQARAERERAGQPFLVFRDRDGRQERLSFAPGLDSVSVGRRSSSDLVLDWDDQVSRQHARFERAHDAWVIVDDGPSSNGTFVNEERVTGKRRLSDGDAVRFGTTTVTFHLPAPAPARPPAPEPARPPAPEPARAPVPPRPKPPGGVSLSTAQRRVLAALCRPYKDRRGFASPATDEQIADELFLSVGEVKAHIKVLYVKLGFTEAPKPETRVRLAERAFSTGLVSERDL